jgi:uncharacterized membrane protein
MKISSGNITKTAILAALYAVLTVAIAPLSYGAVQFRLSEIMVLLCFYNPAFVPAMVIGCAIANLFSPMGMFDVAFGSVATLAAVFPMAKVKNIFLAALFPVLANGIIIGAELALTNGGHFFEMASSVAVGEAGVVFAGAVVFRFVIERNTALMRFIKGGTVEE